jgi:apolipoprotein N-acyltransferase
MRADQAPTPSKDRSGTLGAAFCVLVGASLLCWVGFVLWLVPDVVALLVTLATVGVFFAWRRARQ